MVTKKEFYEISMERDLWTDIAKKFLDNNNSGEKTIIEHTISGEPAKCLVTGFLTSTIKKPAFVLKHKVRVQVLELMDSPVAA